MSVTKDQIEQALRDYPTKESAANALGISRYALYRRMKGEEYTVSPPSTPSTTEVEEISPLEEHKLKKENSRLKKQLREALEFQLETEDLRSLYSSANKASLNPKSYGHSGETPNQDIAWAVSILSDTHFDEVVQPEEIGYLNAYNREIAEERLSRYFRNFNRLVRYHSHETKIEGLCIMLGGDMVSGDIHEELVETNEDSILATCLHWAEKLAEGFTYTLEANPDLDLVVPCVVGNHGRTTKRFRHKEGVKHNFDWLIYKLLEKHFAGNDRIEFNIPNSVDCTFKIYDTRYLLNHGNKVRGGGGWMGALGPLMRGIHKRDSREISVGGGFDLMVVGHWHQLVSLKRLVVNGSLKGYDEFAAGCDFAYEDPQQGFWLTAPKKEGKDTSKMHFTPIFVK